MNWERVYMHMSWIANLDVMVLMDILHESKEIGVIVDGLTFETILKEVSEADIFLIVILRVTDSNPLDN